VGILFGTGFPKSLDISKAIDKAAGIARGTNPDTRNGPNTNAGTKGDGKIGGYPNTGCAAIDTGPATPEAQQWDGWGTALKPAMEDWHCFQKPANLVPLIDVLSEVEQSINLLLWSIAPAKFAEAYLASSPSGCAGAPFGFVQWIAAEFNTDRFGDLSDWTDTYNSPEAVRIFLSTALSWSATSGVLWKNKSTFTTGTECGLTTGLRILSYLVSGSIPASIIQGWIAQNTASCHVSSAALSSVETRKWLISIRTHSVRGNATTETLNAVLSALVGIAEGSSGRLRVANASSVPRIVTTNTGANDGQSSTAMEDWWLLRKPLEKGATVADNVCKYGTGGINVDGCRVDALDGVPQFTKRCEPTAAAYANGLNGSNRTGEIDRTTGRFPANLTHDGSDEVLALFPMTTTNSIGKALQTGQIDKKKEQGNAYGEYRQHVYKVDYASTGSAARFFYCSKASPADRNSGITSEFKWFNSLELVTEFGTFTGSNLFVTQWENQGQNPSQDAPGDASQKKGTSGDTTLQLVDSGLSTSCCGSEPMVLFPTAIRFTTATGTSQTIDLKTSNYYQGLTIKESIRDAIETNQANGLSLVGNVGLQNLLSLIFTKDAMGYPRGVRVVASKTPQSTSVNEAWPRSNNHETVKSQKLMRWLCRLITPPGGLILDCFAGSGTTALAARAEGFGYVLITDDAHHVDIIHQRLAKMEPLFATAE